MDVELMVKGMNCGHCEKAVMEATTALEGVKHVDVHLDSGRVKVSYNQEQVTLEEICEAIEGQGYDVDR